VSDIGIEVKEFNGEGYAPLISYNGWRVAIANFCERLCENNICKVERHLKTDEVFILLEGEACLHLGMELKRIPMETGKIFFVTRSRRHTISMIPNTKVAIIENHDTGPENTEYHYFS
jgi:mannose-6-phosphate isomerase-like protein (cupin superfamily)